MDESRDGVLLRRAVQGGQVRSPVQERLAQAGSSPSPPPARGAGRAAHADRVGHLGEPEVDDGDGAVRAKQHVACVHVTVQHSALVHGGVGVENRDGHGTAGLVVTVGHGEIDGVAGDLGEHERAAGRGRLVPHEPRDVGAGQRGEAAQRGHLAGEEVRTERRLVDDLDDDRRPVAQLSAPHLAVAQGA